MSATNKREGGKFSEVRERHLPLFNHGRAHSKAKQEEKPDQSAPADEKPRRGSWKTFGIFHFSTHDED